MCAFFELWELKFKVQTSFEAQNFVLLLSLSLHSSSPPFKLLSMASFGGELLLNSSSPWSGVSNHLSSFSILLPLILMKQRTLLMKKIQGLQAPMELHHTRWIYIEKIVITTCNWLNIQCNWLFRRSNWLNYHFNRLKCSS